MSDIKGIREYNRIRRYMEHIYLYGFFSREDFESAGIGSVKDYDYGTALLRAMYPEMDDTAIWDEGKKHLRFVRRYEDSGENRLANSYLFHSIDAESELSDLLLILLFSEYRPKSMEEINAGGDLLYYQGIERNYATSRRRFLDLANQGYLTKAGRKFSLTKTPFAHLDTDSLIDVYSFVCFASETTYPQVAGSFLRRSIARELRHRGVDLSRLQQECLLRRNSNRGVFDEEIVYELLDAIQAKEAVCITIGKRALKVIPIALRVDTHYGRWYLLAYGKDRPQICRVSRVQSVKRLEKMESQDWGRLRDAVLNMYQFAGCSGRQPAEGEPTLLEAQLRFGDNRGMYYQFMREMRIGSIAENGGQLVYQAKVNDPIELLPFLRKFSPWLEIISGEHGLSGLLKEDLLQMKMQLEDAEEAEL